MRAILFFALTPAMLISIDALAKRKHHAHEHGHAKLTIAVESDKSVAIELRSPGESIFGFEHKPGNAAERKRQSDALTTLRSGIGELIKFDSSLGCKFAKAHAEIEDDHGHGKHGKHGKHGSGSHNEVHAKYEVSCGKAVHGSEIRVDFHDRFPRISELDVQILSGKGQKKLELDHAKGTVKLP